ncbi:MAG: DUF4346 domain-containing protein [Calditrichaeota bacterium]|nr:MAG: DUF4346 domain-containing protein [Calditrichota bacterium]
MHRFQQQVQVINLIGETALQKISEAVLALHVRNPGKFEGRTPKVRKKAPLVAHPPKRLRLDKKGFFVILPRKDEHKIYVEYYANSGKLIETIAGDDAASIYGTIIENGFVSQLDHAAYLGKELTRAEYFLKYDIPFVQDRAPGELDENDN